MPVLETERRKNHIDMIDSDSDHPLLPIAKDCLYYMESKRPSSEEPSQRLYGLKDSSRYKESIQQEDQAKYKCLN